MKTKKKYTPPSIETQVAIEKLALGCNGTSGFENCENASVAIVKGGSDGCGIECSS